MDFFQNSTKKIIISIIALFFMMSANFIVNWRVIRPPARVNLQEQKITIDKNIVDILSLGNRRFVSSIYWIETLLDSDIKHYEKNDLGNWMFNRFDTITSLDPLFYEAYLFGGIYLSIVKDDERGAKLIYEKGLKQFPQDLDLLYNAGFNDYFELNDTGPALEKFEKIANIPGGFKKYPYIISLSQRIKATEGFSLEEIYNLLLKNYSEQKNLNGSIKNYFSRTLYGLRAEIDLECLNGVNNNSCNKTDFEGRPYLFDNKKKIYFARKSWKKFKIHKKLQN